MRLVLAVVVEGTVAKDHGAFTRGVLGLVPFGDPERERLNILHGNLHGEANNESPCADAMNNSCPAILFVSMAPRGRGRASGAAHREFLFGAVRFRVVDGVEQGLSEIFVIWLPRPDVRRVELEDAEAEVAGVLWMLPADRLGRAPTSCPPGRCSAPEEIDTASRCGEWRLCSGEMATCSVAGGSLGVCEACEGTCLLCHAGDGGAII